MKRYIWNSVGYAIGMLTLLIAVKYIDDPVWRGFVEGIGVAVSWTFININQEDNDRN